ncbi:MAG: hypothetical protein ABWJ90_04985 [Thermus sp.]|nr:MULTISPECIES: hypothetical protein [Thermus]
MAAWVRYLVTLVLLLLALVLPDHRPFLLLLAGLALLLSRPRACPRA